TAEAGNVDIRTNYTGIKLGYDSAYHFDFQITTEYAGVNGKEDLEINISREKSKERYYEGYHGSANSGNSMKINSDYGSISLRKN
ncbi:MAG: hypothetical protein WBM95_13910, partial [Robiginitalea sp.]